VKRSASGFAGSDILRVVGEGSFNDVQTVVQFHQTFGATFHLLRRQGPSEFDVGKAKHFEFVP
jgi:hypothetical protein